MSGHATFSLELDMLYGGQVNVKRMSSPMLFIRSEADAKAVYDEFEREFSESFSPLVVNRPGGVYLDSFVVKVTVPTEKPPLDAPSAGQARLATCDVGNPRRPIGPNCATSRRRPFTRSRCCSRATSCRDPR